MLSRRHKDGKQEVRAVIKYFYFKGLTPQYIFTDTKETLGESAPE